MNFGVPFVRLLGVAAFWVCLYGFCAAAGEDAVRGRPAPPVRQAPPDGPGGRPGERPDGARMWPEVRAVRDLAYVPDGHERQKLDIYLPKEAAPDAKLPVIVWVHGGAWRGGSKEQCPAVWFVRRGYAVASIGYRLSQHAIFPAQLEDCKAAIRYLRANAGTYGLNPDRFGVWGSSAGGHLAASLGTTGDVKDFDKGPNLEFSSRVQVVCDFFGPSDFTKMADFESRIDHNAPDAPEALLVGGPVQEKKDECRRANPVTYVTKDDPPFLIVHGDKDPIVPFNQSELLRDALSRAGVDVRFHAVKDGGHGFRDKEVDRMVLEFFDKHLQPQAPTPAPSEDKPGK